MRHDHFTHKAASFDHNQDRVSNVDSIAAGIVQQLPLHKDMHLMDFGSGTGLLLERIAPHVGRITAVDVSPAMNQQLLQKVGQLGCAVEVRAVDLSTDTLADRFDGIISSMTLHHVRDIPALLRTFHGQLAPGGFIALADLDTEDGSFHSEDTGVFHAGFDRAELARMAQDAGFGSVAVASASTIHKQQRDYPVFLLTARR